MVTFPVIVRAFVPLMFNPLVVELVAFIVRVVIVAEVISNVTVCVEAITTASTEVGAFLNLNEEPAATATEAFAVKVKTVALDID